MTNLQRARELLGGLLMLAGGIAVVCQPEIGVMFIVLIVVVTTILKGVGSLLYYVSMARHMVGGKLQLYKGIILLDVGMFFLSQDDVPMIYLVLYLLILLPRQTEYPGVYLLCRADLFRSFAHHFGVSAIGDCLYPVKISSDRKKDL